MSSEPTPPQRTPWASVVRGGDSDNNASPTAAEVEVGLGPEAQTESSVSAQAQDEPSGSRSRRPVWNRPTNGVVEAGGSVMGGAVSWPALSESARAGGSRQVVSDGSASGSSPQAPIISPPPQRASNNNTHGHSTGNNNSASNRPRRNRGGGGGNSSASGQHQIPFNRPSVPITPPPPPPPFPVFEGPYMIAAPVIDVPMRSPRPAGGGSGSQGHMGGDHSSSSSQRNNSRRGGSYSPRPRGDGSFHNNHGNRRDQDRRDVHVTLPQFVHPPPPVGFMPPPPPPPPLAAAGAASLMAPPHLRVFPGQYDMPQALVYLQPMIQDPYRPTMPMAPPPPPLPFSPANEITLADMIVSQINFYFSDDNLARDGYLRSNMDEQGWVPISLIATFRRVQQLTNDVTLILDALRNSTILEVQGERVRRRNGWSKWRQSSGTSNNNSAASGSQTPPVSAEDAPLSASMQSLSLDESSANANGEEGVIGSRNEMVTGRPLHEDSRLANGEGASEPDHSIS